MLRPTQIKEIILARIDRHHPPILLSQLISDALTDGGSVHISDAQEHAEKIFSRVMNGLSQYIETRNELNQSCAICFSESDTIYLQGVDHAHSSDDDDITQLKDARRNAEQLQQKIRKLSPQQFELLMGNLLTGIGVHGVVITSSSSDDGVDFFGRMNLGKFAGQKTLQDHFLNEVEVLIVGQAKRYATSKFKLADVRELVGSVQLLRSQVSARAKPLEQITAKVADPVVNLFVISNAVSAAGWRLAQRSGVKILDLEKLSILMTDLGIEIPDAVE
jgi:HJR/Mrr/RecB family endonuclease